MKKYCSLILICLCIQGFAQAPIPDLQNIWRVNFLNPSLEHELALGEKMVVSAGLGVGYGGSYRELEIGSANGFVYIISPFLDLQFKRFYNRAKRLSEDRDIGHNSGNYVSMRGIVRGGSLAENVKRKDNIDVAIGPTWGLQRAYGKFHFLFDIGPQYYFDTRGNGGFFPLMVQINLGLNLSSR